MAKKQAAGGKRKAQPAAKDPIPSAVRSSGKESREKQTPSMPSPTGKPGRSPVVAIGASAGGLEAFQRLLNSLPPESKLSFVILQHLAPHYDSILPELLARASNLPVIEAKDGMELHDAAIYVMPPNVTMTLDE